LKHADYVIRPAIDSIGNSDFGQIDFMIAQGYAAAWPVLSALRDRLAAQGDGRAYDSSSWYVQGSIPDSIAWVSHGSTVGRTGLERVLERETAMARYRRLNVDVLSQSDTAVLSWDIEALPAVTRAEVLGNTLLPDSETARLMRPLEGRGLCGTTLRTTSDSLERRYRGAGYPLVAADSVHFDTSGRLVLQVEENPVVALKVEGQKRTQTRFILDNLPDLEHKPLSSRELSSGVNSLYATGLFRSVAARTVRTPAGPEVVLQVEEQDFTRVRFGGHWHDEFRAEAFAELADVNVFGRGHHAALLGMYGERRQFIEGSLGADRLASTYLTYSLRAYYHNEEWRVFVLGTELPMRLHYERLGVRLAVGQQLKRFGLLSLGLRVEDIDDYIEPGLKYTPWNLRTLFVQAELDTYDRFPLPRSGYRQRIVLERAVDAFGGNTEYTKFWFELEGVLPLGREHVALLGGAAGTSDTWLPEPERYLLGGRPSFLGLHTGEGRGDYFWRSHAALRLHNGGSRFITLQYNLGNIWTHDAQIDLLEVIHGVGVAYTLDTRVGPLDFGVGLATDRSAVGYINLGLPF
jgi:outer membrane protein insertion porin family